MGESERDVAGYRFDDVRIDLRTERVFHRDAAVGLEPKAYELLLFLARNPGRLLEKREILESVWSEASVTENAMTRVVAQLRRELDDDAHDSRLIETVPTRGYRFLADVETEYVAAPTRFGWRWFAPVVVAGLTGVAAGILGTMGSEVADAQPLATLRVTLAFDTLSIPVAHHPVLDISRDGSMVALMARAEGDTESAIFLRRLDTEDAVLVRGTGDGAGAVLGPRWRETGVFA